jgi:hypothetical protein
MNKLDLTAVPRARDDPAQKQPEAKDKEHKMTHILPGGGGKALINVDDTALLLLDHQAGLFQTVKDITVAELRANVMALTRIATLLNCRSSQRPRFLTGRTVPLCRKSPNLHRMRSTYRVKAR